MLAFEIGEESAEEITVKMILPVEELPAGTVVDVVVVVSAEAAGEVVVVVNESCCALWQPHRIKKRGRRSRPIKRFKLVLFFMFYPPYTYIYYTLAPFKVKPRKPEFKGG